MENKKPSISFKFPAPIYLSQLSENFPFLLRLDQYQPGEKSSKNSRFFGLLFEPIVAPEWAPKWFQYGLKNKLTKMNYFGTRLKGFVDLNEPR